MPKTFSNLLEAIEAYDEVFEWPGTWAMRHIHTDAKRMAVIADCLAKGKDMYELGYLPKPPDDPDIYW